MQVIMEIGGLCMLVQSESVEKGLHILMPSMKASGMVHCAMIMTHKDNDAKGNRLLPFDGHAEDLRAGITSGSVVTMPGELLAMSRYAGLRVDNAWLGDTPDMTTCLGARLIVPLGATIEPKGDPGYFFVPGEANELPFKGRSIIKFELTGTELQVAGQTLASNGKSVKLRVVNIPPAHLDEKLRPAVKNTPAYHLEGYYSLLKDNCPASVIKPILIARGQKGDPTACPSTDECPVEKPYHDWEPPAMLDFVDPFSCTMSYGCAELDPKCDSGDEIVARS